MDLIGGIKPTVSKLDKQAVMTFEYSFYHYFKIFAKKEQKYENNHRIFFYIYEKIIGCYR